MLKFTTPIHSFYKNYYQMKNSNSMIFSTVIV